MISFLILIILYTTPCIYFLIKNIKKGNYKHLFKWIIAIILLLIVACIESINL